MQNTAIKESSGDRIFNGINYVVLIIFTLTVLYPLVFIVSASFSSPEAVSAGKVWLYPINFSLEGYAAVFKHKMIATGFLNSIYYTVVGTIINLILTFMVAYPLSRKDFQAKNVIMALFVFTTLFSGGLIPSFLLVKELGMLDTRWALIIPGAVTVWNMIVSRTFFKVTFPDELLEAAQIDGCSDFKFIWKIVLPLSGPIIAVMSLFYAVAHWNTYFNALIYLKDQHLYPLQLVLREILIQNQVDPAMLTDVSELASRAALTDLLKYSLIVVSTIPIMIVYPFVQKHFVKGMMIGSLKG
ncbi:carbohydrate ABC transporter permease [Paenibacillus yanchengensis]|uniref:Carbohydrate ABC transporter permease n=1 Tax=Paenibacillus yanchengensis TaxID=2035833 RepID=A0ABW4YR70_9BACL